MRKISELREQKLFTWPNTQLNGLPFSEKEKTLFVNSDVTFAAKYAAVWNKKNLSLLLVKSASARTHHDPEVCLQGLGYHLLREEPLLLSDIQVKHIEIQTSNQADAPRADVYYWYVSQDGVMADYSERVWAQFQKPDQAWVLVEVAVLQSEKIDLKDLEVVVHDLTQSVKMQLTLQEST